MTDLSPELRNLFQAVGEANRPTDADRERVFDALHARLGATPGAGAVQGVAPRSISRTLSGKVIAVTVATLALVAGGVTSMQLMTRRSAPEVVSSKVDSVRLSAAKSATKFATGGYEVLPPKTQNPAPQEALPVVSEAKLQPATTSPTSRRPLRPHDRLSEEAAILSRAQSELHGGRAASALRVLAEHERKFNRGILAQERTAVRIQALCALGRVSEANGLMAVLSPQSLTGDSARQACSAKKGVPQR